MPGAHGPWKILLAAAALLIVLVGATVAAGAILRLVAGAHPEPIDWIGTRRTALISDTASMRLDAVASHGDRFVAIGSGGGVGIIVGHPTAKPRIGQRPAAVHLGGPRRRRR